MIMPTAPPLGALFAQGDDDERFSPALMVEVELTQPLPALNYDGQRKVAWVLGRLHGEPVGACVIPFDHDGLTPEQVGALLWAELSGPVTDVSQRRDC